MNTSVKTKLKITKRQYIVKAPSILDKILPWRSGNAVETLSFESTDVVSLFSNAIFGHANTAFLWALEFTDNSIVESIDIIDSSVKSCINLPGPLTVETQKGDIKRILIVEAL